MGLSLANISLVAPSSPLLTAASEFYVDLLGFRIISQTTETTWLHLFAYQPMDACIRLSNTVSVADLTAKQSQIQSELVKGTIPSTPSVLPVFFMEDLTVSLINL
jgi:catechol 2,3-dioxygenase-like lactoylglutathione lyase family enzyme